MDISLPRQLVPQILKRMKAARPLGSRCRKMNLHPSFQLLESEGGPLSTQASQSLIRLVELSGLSRSTLIEIRAGRSRPHRKNQKLLAVVMRNMGLI
jgi:hypothetical protein